MRKKWRGTALFSIIMAALSVTVAGRLLSSLGSSEAQAATDTGTSTGTSAATGTGTDSGTTGESSGSGASSDSGSSASSSSSPSPSASSSSSAKTVVNGSVESTRFGDVQVAVTFDGDKITAVEVLQAPSRDGRDQEITSYATPELEQEVISSQSANVDTVSGATYTSEGYLASVQSAIDAHG